MPGTGQLGVVAEVPAVVVPHQLPESWNGGDGQDSVQPFANSRATPAENTSNTRLYSRCEDCNLRP